MSRLGFLGDHGDDSATDEDWIAVQLHEDYTYEFVVKSAPDVPNHHQARSLKILGIYDKDGNSISGTASANSGTEASVTFTPTETNDEDKFHYIAVGVNGSDETGLYQLTANWWQHGN